MGRSTHIVLICQPCVDARVPRKQAMWTWKQGAPRPQCLKHMGTPLTPIGEKPTEEGEAAEQSGDPEQ